MRRAIQLLVAYISFFAIFVGIMFMLRSFQVISQPLAGQPTWLDYRLEFMDPFLFYVGCAVSSAGLVALWWLKIDSA
jgi:fucose 4-O-acetylase-like acetyltransferase